MAAAADSKSAALKACGFESHLRHGSGRGKLAGATGVEGAMPLAHLPRVCLVALLACANVPAQVGPPGGGPRGGPPEGGPPGRGPRRNATVAAPLDLPYQNLWIPPLLEGTSIDLSLDEGSRTFIKGVTPTLGFNRTGFWGPTLVMNRGETVQVRVKNNLKEVTTVHWHGLHLPAAADGGPHQPIEPGATWTTSFKVDNNAATYWYHPHPHELTQKQHTLGAGGLIIIRDAEEARLALPRTYGVDDIPVVLTSRRFRSDQRFSHNGDHDKYGDYLLVNGVLNPQARVPAQVVRLRILNAEVERGYILGFPDNRTFHVIATDGGLVDKPVPVKRLRLMVGERAEILVDLSADKPGSTLDLTAYNSRQPFGFPGGEPDKGGDNGSLLNNADFRVLHLIVGAAGARAVTRIPDALARNRYPTREESSRSRVIKVTEGRPFFSLDGRSFDMHVINQAVKLGATETWTIVNNNIFGHSFHIHDVQFRIVARSDGPVADQEQGWKDTVYLPRNQSVTFVARFLDHASDTDPFMYHCHMANHEDGGMMGQFLVSRDPEALERDAAGAILFRKRVEHPVSAAAAAEAARQARAPAPAFDGKDADGRPLRLASLAAAKPVLLYFIERECPCSRDAAVHLQRLQDAYGPSITVVGVINATAASAKEWQRQAKVTFPVLLDPFCEVIHAYKAERSALTILVAPGAGIAKAYPGYNAASLDDLNERVAALVGAPRRPVSTEGAPAKLTAGCTFPE